MIDNDSLNNRHVTVLRLLEVKSRTGLSRSSIYAYIKERKFPAPISLGLRCVGWLESEISDWIASRISESRASKNEVQNEKETHL